MTKMELSVALLVMLIGSIQMESEGGYEMKERGTGALYRVNKRVNETNDDLSKSVARTNALEEEVDKLRTDLKGDTLKLNNKADTLTTDVEELRTQTENGLSKHGEKVESLRSEIDVLGTKTQESISTAMSQISQTKYTMSGHDSRLGKLEAAIANLQSYVYKEFEKTNRAVAILSTKADDIEAKVAQLESKITADISNSVKKAEEAMTSVAKLRSETTKDTAQVKEDIAANAEKRERLEKEVEYFRHVVLGPTCPDLHALAKVTPSDVHARLYTKNEEVSVYFPCNNDYIQRSSGFQGTCTSSKTWQRTGSSRCVPPYAFFNYPRDGSVNSFGCALPAGSTVTVEGKPTRYQTFAIDILDNSSSNRILHMSFRIPYYYLVINRYLGWWQSEIRRYGSSFPWRYNKAFTLVFLVTSSGWKVYDATGKSTLSDTDLVVDYSSQGLPTTRISCTGVTIYKIKYSNVCN